MRSGGPAEEANGTPEVWGRLLFGIVLLSGAAFAIVTPPFQAPDERDHFFRAFAVSEGRIFLEGSAGSRGLILPEGVTRVLAPEADEMAAHPERKTSVSATVSAVAVRLVPDRRVFVGCVASGSGFVTYLPQAFGIAVARLFSDSVLILFYAGRLASVAVSALLFALAARRAACARPLFFVLALTPISVFLAASFSADAVTNAVAFLLVATALGWSTEKVEPLSARDLTFMICLSAVLGLSKQAYVFLPAAFLAVPGERFGSWRRRWVSCGAALAASIGAMAGWTAAFALLAYGSPREVDPWRQAAHVLTAPFAVAGDALMEHVRSLPRLAHHTAGVLGWLDTRLPAGLVAGILLTILFVAATGGSRKAVLSPRQRAVLLGVLAASVVWRTLLLYLFFTPVGSHRVLGMQGRYLIPLGPLFFALLYNRRWLIDWERQRPLLALWTGAWQAVALGAVVVRYYM